MKFKFDMIGLFVENIQAMVNFYTNVIGLETDWNGEDPYAEFQHEGNCLRSALRVFDVRPLRAARAVGPDSQVPTALERHL